MRPLRYNECAPSKCQVEDIYNLKPSVVVTGSGSLRQRMQKSCYLDANGRRLSTFQRLKAQYESDGLTLFLGAGVSVGSGVRSWRDLVDALLADVLSYKAQKGQSASRILSEQANLSLPAQFSLISEYCSTDNDFTTRLIKCLYGGEKFRKIKELLESIPLSNKQKVQAKTTTTIWKPLQAKIEKDNPTLAAVGKLLVDWNAKSPLCNGKIHAVITTNADNLLQNYVMALARGRRLLNTVDRPSVGDHPGMISVFHLHGFLDSRTGVNNNGTLPQTPSADEEPEPGRLVFRESEYFDVIASPTGFANYTAHSFLQRTNVLFIGASLDDVNLRRWLYTSCRERIKARAAYLRRIYGEYKDAAVEARYAALRHFWLRSKKDLPKLNSGSKRDNLPALIEELSRTLGIEVIWYKDHSEIAELLLALWRG